MCSVMFSASPRGVSAIQSSNRFFIAAAVAVFFVYYSKLMISSPALLQDPDTFWHIVTGQWILDHAQVPTVDFYSYTETGKPWISTEWLGEVLLAAAFKLGGWRGVTILTGVSCAGIIGIVCFYLLQHLRFSVAIGLTALTDAAINMHFIARPVVFSYVFLVIWMIKLLEAYDNDKFDLPSPFVLAPLMVLWANIHGSFTFGLALLYIFAGFCLYQSFIKRDYAKCRRLAITVFVVSLSACITPYGFAPIFMTTKLMGMNAIRQIIEWRPPDFQQLPLLLSYLIALLAAIAGLGIRLRHARLVAFALIAFIGFRYIRGLFMFFALVPILLARPAAACAPYLAPQPSRTKTSEGDKISDPVLNFLQQRSMTILASCMVVAVAITASSWWRQDIVPTKSIMPKAAIDFVRRANITGNVLNSYNFGGYLIWSGIPTFIDGRAELFGDAFLTKFFAASDSDTDSGFALLDEYKVSWVLLVPKLALAKALARSEDWNEVYSDEYAAVFVRRH
ncbi:MAG: hypothetical protein WB760_09405 [Xanthobacteraceae bacterium]